MTIDSNRLSVWHLDDGAREVEYNLADLPSTNGSYTVEPFNRRARAIRSVVYYCEGGSCTLSLTRNGVATSFNTVSCTTSVTTANISDPGIAVAAGNVVKLVVTNATDLVNLHVKVVTTINKDADG